MGSVVSSVPAGRRNANNVTSESVLNVADSDMDDSGEEYHDATDEDEGRARAKEEEMTEFKKQLSIKREQRREILNRHRAEKAKLEELLKSERSSKLILHKNNEQLRDLLIQNNIEIPENLRASEVVELTDAINQMREEFDRLKELNNKLRRDLVEANSALQGAYSDIADLNAQHTESIKQINALKEVVSVSKTLLNLREGQLNELKNKLNEIERSLSDREASMLSVDLRQEYERQLQNIRTLRGLYEERARLAEVTRQGLVRDLDEQKRLYQAEVNKNKELSAKVITLDENIETLQDIVENKNIEISSLKDVANGLKAEMAIVNKLFSQVLLGYKTKQDLDKLVHRLEENHGILTHMAEKESDSEASTELPKMLLELVNQMDENEGSKTDNEVQTEAQSSSQDTEVKPSTTPEEIVENLPKVWRVLMELLSHQTVPEDVEEKVTTCYKLVETKSGPVQVPSVSQTYIRLKDLIVEKLGLVKEVNRMKQLNAHLENRLQEQEKRLCLVTTELSKTWHVVGKLRRQHFQLHTHEKILKYELQQKRKLLNELKEELEYCREKWEQAREKNTQSERDWRKLRAEFTSRKTKSGSPSFNNSAESGYSDERPSEESSESNDESEYVAEPPMRCKKKMKKSFETIVDSSADYNLAEREDPVSDMLDVADLPLDTHENTENVDASSECSKSENMLKSDKICETEDEICDITHDDSFIEDSLQNNPETSGSKIKDITDDEQPECSTSTSSTLIDPATILENVRKQNERLARKDEKLEYLEKNSSEILKKMQATAKIGEEINNTLDHILSRPNTTQTEKNTEQSLVAATHTTETVSLEVVNNDDNSKITSENIDKPSTSTTIAEPGLSSDCPKQLPEVDFKAILENVRLQNERLAKKDERLQSLENNSLEVVKNITSTLRSGDEIIEKLDTIHNQYNPIESNAENPVPTNAENPVSTNAENPVSTNAQIPLSTNAENPVSTNAEIPLSTNAENPVSTSAENPVSTNAENSVSTNAENPLSINTDIPVSTNAENPLSTDAENPVSTRAENPVSTSAENPVSTNAENPLSTSAENPVTTNAENPASTNAENSEADIIDSEEPMERYSEPSTSEVDHEARFAARDLRLKRLEEQTKSLVKKVNKTNSKGVKIKYKLDELHNIYGSENSRAGTPSEDVEDKSTSEDSDTNKD